ncbi:hypothetical protein OG429_18330 [Streptomyces sp. NBC_00190]|uniref:hypothetical protein n=1 Tax=Streptomyces sp. NBC_00190 TaxID=2903634 RepID=UPI002E2A0B73|nr:hypothetical protein [Streptomyces sp. NBC_00190]
MTEPQNDMTPAQAPAQAPAEAVAPAAAPAAAPEPAKPARTVGRKKLALIAAGVAAAVLVGGGVWGFSAIAGADRTAPTAYWVAAGERVPTAEEAAEVPPNALTGKLLPVPGGFTPGPDLDGDGNNFFVSGEKAVETLKEAREGLSSSERKKRDDMLAGLKLKGLAGRGYTGRHGDLVVEVSIMQADPQALGTFSEITKKLLEFAGDGREAPKVDGFPDAKCSLLAVGEDEKDNEKKEKVDSLYCVAVQGDVLVNFRAYGRTPFQTSDAVGFFKNQLSHLKSPGESV